MQAAHAPLNRHDANPILTAADWPYPAHTVFNPAATRLADGATLLFCRVEDHRGQSHLCAARSVDGRSNWIIDAAPTLAPDADRPEEAWGLEDPRITFLEELGRYAVTFTSYGAYGPCVSLALTEDFRSFERLGIVLPPENKDAALLPERVDGRWAMIHRPVAELGAHIWISYSTDLVHWGDHRVIFEARGRGWWDGGKIGIGPPVIDTPSGWLMVYHGVRMTCDGAIYRVGLALLDRAKPERVLRRSGDWILAPDAPYERVGDVGNVVFPCGVTLDDDADSVNVYYGAADTSVALARGSLRAMLAWMERGGG